MTVSLRRCATARSLQLRRSTITARHIDDVWDGESESGLDIAGEAPASDKAAEGDCGECASSIASQPAPFGGPWYSRPKLTGDWCGLREQLRDNGLTFDISTTAYYQGVASGGLQETFEFGGRNDYLLNVDGQKAGLWQGFSINLHGETVYGDSVNLATGAVVPVNIGRAHPVFFGDETALTAVKFTQARIGKLRPVRREDQYDRQRPATVHARARARCRLHERRVRLEPDPGTDDELRDVGRRRRHPGGRSPGGHANRVRYQRCLHHERLR